MTTIFKNKRIEICTYSKDSHSIVLDSGDEHYPGCTLKLTGFGYWVSVRLPAIIKPFRWKVKAKHWTPEMIASVGQDWYWNCDSREYGIGIHCGNHFNIYYGRQSDDCSLERRWSCFLPWTELKQVRWTGYGLDGERLLEFDRSDVRIWSPQRDSLPKARFLFADFDDQKIIATTHIEETEYSKGVRSFSWLRYLVRNKVFRTLHIEFNREVGRNKGSWKGGTVGHSIELRPGELHEQAFRRYCQEQNLRFIGKESAKLVAA